MNPEYVRQAFEMFLSWVRVFLAAAIAVYTTTGVADWQAMFNAGMAACLPVILRFLDPMDKNYGRGAGEDV
jgi:hypothetical protein